jgi:hypothetical protein
LNFWNLLLAGLSLSLLSVSFSFLFKVLRNPLARVSVGQHFFSFPFLIAAALFCFKGLYMRASLFIDLSLTLSGPLACFLSLAGSLTPKLMVFFFSSFVVQ